MNQFYATTDRRDVDALAGLIADDMTFLGPGDGNRDRRADVDMNSQQVYYDPREFAEAFGL